MITINYDIIKFSCLSSLVSMIAKKVVRDQIKNKNPFRILQSTEKNAEKSIFQYK